MRRAVKKYEREIAKQAKKNPVILQICRQQTEDPSK